MLHFRGVQEGYRCYYLTFLFFIILFGLFWSLELKTMIKQGFSFIFLGTSFSLHGWKWLRLMFSQWLVNHMNPSSVQLNLWLIYVFAASQFLNLTSALHSLHLVFQTESVSCEPGGKYLGVSSSLFSLFLGQDPVPGPCPLPGLPWCREGALPGVQLLWVKVALLQPQQVLSSICFLRRFQAAWKLFQAAEKCLY